MLTKEDLKAISEIVKDGLKGVESRLDGVESRLDGVESRLDKVESRLDKVENDVKVIRVKILENDVIPRLSHIEECYLSVSDRYVKSADKFDDAIADISIMKQVLQKHSADIQELKLKQA